MKKLFCLLLSILMLTALTACGGKAPQPESAEWTRQGYFTNESENILSVTWMDDVVDPGWYVGFLNGEDWVKDSYGGTLRQEGNTLHGSLVSGGEKGEMTVTVSEEGEDGLKLVVDGGETYHFSPMDLPQASIIVHINVEGWGNIDHAQGETAPEIDPEYPFQSAQINLAEPAVYTLAAWPNAGNLFVKWTKNGEDFSTEPQITILLDESADFVAVFEEDPAWQNPVMNFVGEYQCGEVRARVECSGWEDARIVIERDLSARETTSWFISGRLDTDTLRVEYPGCAKVTVVLDDDGEVKSDETENEEIPGVIAFHDDGTFTWHRESPETGEDMVFEWVPVGES